MGDDADLGFLVGTDQGILDILVRQPVARERAEPATGEHRLDVAGSDVEVVVGELQHLLGDGDFGPVSRPRIDFQCVAARPAGNADDAGDLRQVVIGRQGLDDTALGQVVEAVRSRVADRLALVNLRDVDRYVARRVDVVEHRDQVPQHRRAGVLAAELAATGRRRRKDPGAAGDMRQITPAGGDLCVVDQIRGIEIRLVAPAGDPLAGKAGSEAHLLAADEVAPDRVGDDLTQVVLVEDRVELPVAGVQPGVGNDAGEQVEVQLLRQFGCSVAEQRRVKTVAVDIVGTAEDPPPSGVAPGPLVGHRSPLALRVLVQQCLLEGVHVVAIGAAQARTPTPEVGAANRHGGRHLESLREQLERQGQVRFEQVPMRLIDRDRHDRIRQGVRDRHHVVTVRRHDPAVVELAPGLLALRIRQIVELVEEDMVDVPHLATECHVPDHVLFDRVDGARCRIHDIEGVPGAAQMHDIVAGTQRQQQRQRGIDRVDPDLIVAGTRHQRQAFDAVDAFELEAGAVEVLPAVGVLEDVELVGERRAGHHQRVETAAAVDLDPVVLDVIDQHVLGAGVDVVLVVAGAGRNVASRQFGTGVLQLRLEEEGVVARFAEQLQHADVVVDLEVVVVTPTIQRGVETDTRSDAVETIDNVDLLTAEGDGLGLDDAPDQEVVLAGIAIDAQRRHAVVKDERVTAFVAMNLDVLGAEIVIDALVVGRRAERDRLACRRRGIGEVGRPGQCGGVVDSQQEIVALGILGGTVELDLPRIAAGPRPAHRDLADADRRQGLKCQLDLGDGRGLGETRRFLALVGEPEAAALAIPEIEQLRLVGGLVEQRVEVGLAGEQRVDHVRRDPCHHRPRHLGLGDRLVAAGNPEELAFGVVVRRQHRDQPRVGRGAGAGDVDIGDAHQRLELQGDLRSAVGIGDVGRRFAVIIELEAAGGFPFELLDACVSIEMHRVGNDPAADHYRIVVGAAGAGVADIDRRRHAVEQSGQGRQGQEIAVAALGAVETHLARKVVDREAVGARAAVEFETIKGRDILDFVHRLQERGIGLRNLLSRYGQLVAGKAEVEVARLEQGVVAGRIAEDIDALGASDDVIAGSGIDPVGKARANDAVVAVAALQGQLVDGTGREDLIGRDLGRIGQEAGDQPVVAGTAVDGDLVVRGGGAVEVDAANGDDDGRQAGLPRRRRQAADEALVRHPHGIVVGLLGRGVVDVGCGQRDRRAAGPDPDRRRGRDPGRRDPVLQQVRRGRRGRRRAAADDLQRRPRAAGEDDAVGVLAGVVIDRGAGEAAPRAAQFGLQQLGLQRRVFVDDLVPDDEVVADRRR